MESLENPVRPYAWGSRTVIAELLGEPVPSPHPQAEMWLGAHPGDPSRLAHGASLLELLAADPETHLGTDRAARWSGTLPFLLKVLAADEPLGASGDLGHHLGAEPRDDGVEYGGDRRQGAQLLDQIVALRFGFRVGDRVAVGIEHWPRSDLAGVVAVEGHLLDRKGAGQIVDDGFFAVEIYVEWFARGRRFP